MPTPGTNVARSAPLRSSIAGVSWNRRSMTSAVTASSLRGPDQFQVLDHAETGGVLQLHAGLDRVLGDAAVPLAERHPQLAPRQVRTEAAVHATTEREVTVDVAVEAD